MRSKGRMIWETPADQNCFVGFHDIVPWSPDGTCLATHRAAQDLLRLEDCRRQIQISLWDGIRNNQEGRCNDRVEFSPRIAIKWLPGSQDVIIFNTVEYGRAVAAKRNVVTGERSVLPGAIASKYVALAHRWKAYGYPAREEIPVPADQAADGLWELDIQSGNETLFISTKRAPEFKGEPQTDLASHFMSHASFSPDGSHVVFLHRSFSPDGGLFTRMIATDREARELVLLAQEKVSHFYWLDNETLLVWAWFGGELARAPARGFFA